MFDAPVELFLTYLTRSRAACSKILNPNSIARFISDPGTCLPFSAFSNILSNDPRAPLARCAQYESAEILSSRGSRSRTSLSGSSSIKKAPQAGFEPTTY